MQVRAKEDGISLNDLAERAFEIILGLPEYFLQLIRENYGEPLKMHEGEVIYTMLTEKIVFMLAWVEIFGRKPPSMCNEFRIDENGKVSGLTLINQLMNEHCETILGWKEKFEEAGISDKAVISKKELESIKRGIGVGIGT